MNVFSKKRVKIVSKTQISNPSNFEHVEHMGKEDTLTKQSNASANTYLQQEKNSTSPESLNKTGLPPTTFNTDGLQLQGSPPIDIRIDEHHQSETEETEHLDRADNGTVEIESRHHWQGSLDAIKTLKSELNDCVEERLLKLLPKLRESDESGHQANTLRLCTCPCQYVSSVVNQSMTHTFLRSQENESDKREFYNTRNAHTQSDPLQLEQRLKPRPVPLLKYPSDLLPVVNRSDSLDGSETGRKVPYRQVEHYVQKRKPGTGANKPDERECMAKALQTNVECIVDGLVFDQSELKEMFVKDECLTEDERDNVVKISDRKDQIRAILVLIKGRDLQVLQNFLHHVENHNRSVYESILKSYETNKAKNMSSPKCSVCKLIESVDIKYIIDKLWSEEIVDDALYRKVLFTDPSNCNQKQLWEEIICAINESCKTERQKVHTLLKESLTKKNHYHHISATLSTCFNYEGPPLRCRCKPVFTANRSWPSSFASVSPHSSTSGSPYNSGTPIPASRGSKSSSTHVKGVHSYASDIVGVVHTSVTPDFTDASHVADTIYESSGTYSTLTESYSSKDSGNINKADANTNSSAPRSTETTTRTDDDDAMESVA